MIQAGITGSPPRMRGKLEFENLLPFESGITPADAGKTLFRRQRVAGHEDHPRGCGENSCPHPTSQKARGSPPRMRGKPASSTMRFALARITPADAGKTARSGRMHRWKRDHPRGCGENKSLSVVKHPPYGSPPRMRGKPIDAAGDLIAGRITPADAGKTQCWKPSLTATQDHPRGCGEN